MSNKSGVSVLIPLSKYDDLTEETICSVVKQTFFRWEMIIGIFKCGVSSQLEKEINKYVSKFQKNGLNIRVIVYGMEEKFDVINNMVFDASYEYISVVENGNLWFSDKLEKQFPFLQNYDVVGSKSEYYGDYSGFPNIRVGELCDTDFLMRNPVCDSTVIIHKKDAFWEENQENFCYEMWVRLNKNKRKFYNVNKVLCKERKIEN